MGGQDGARLVGDRRVGTPLSGVAKRAVGGCAYAHPPQDGVPVAGAVPDPETELPAG
jgi:hypothetical protein